MAVIIGTAKVFAIDGVTVAFTGASALTMEAQSASLTDQFEVTKAKNVSGDTKTIAGSDRVHEVSIKIMWKDAANEPSISGAKSAVKMPTMLAKVTLANFGNSIIDGDWNYAGGSAEWTNEGYATGTFKLIRHGDTPAAFSVVT